MKLEVTIYFLLYSKFHIHLFYVRKNICYIRQHPYIFDGSIKENLLIGNKNIDLNRIKQVCKLMGIDSFVESLPNKYDTILNKGGTNLSGGQVQKLAIARGILQNPKIILLDEITSDLDSDAELSIIKILKELSNKFTIITVAHRISMVLEASEIVVISDGTVVGQGSHEELIKNCEAYKKLYKEQLDRINVKSIQV